MPPTTGGRTIGSTVSARRSRRPGNSTRASTQASGRPKTRQSDGGRQRRLERQPQGLADVRRAEVGDDRAPRRPPQQAGQRQDEEQRRHRPRRQRRDRWALPTSRLRITTTESSPHATTCHGAFGSSTRAREHLSAEGGHTRRNVRVEGRRRMMRKWILAVAALVAVVGPGTGAVWMDSQPSQAADTR